MYIHILDFLRLYHPLCELFADLFAGNGWTPATDYALIYIPEMLLLLIKDSHTTDDNSPNNTIFIAVDLQWRISFPF